MATATAFPSPSLSPLQLLNAAPQAATKLNAATHAKAKASAQEFEAMFLNSMFQQMFTDTEGEGPVGGGGASGVWRSFLTDEYAKSFAKAGGIGVADHVYKALIAQQEIRA